MNNKFQSWAPTGSRDIGILGNLKEFLGVWRQRGTATLAALLSRAHFAIQT